MSYKDLRYATGDTSANALYRENIVANGSLDRQFSFTIENKESTAKRIAVLAGHYDTSSFINTIAKAASGDDYMGTVEKTYMSPEALIAAGYKVDCCIDDGTYEITSKKGIVCQSTDPSKTIRGFREYMRLNPLPLKRMIIISSDKEAFRTNVTVSQSSPFSRMGEQDIDLNTFFSAFQYQSDRIELDFTSKQLEISDISMLFVTVPANTKVTYMLKF